MENADGKEFNMFFKPMCFPFIQVHSGWVGVCHVMVLMLVVNHFNE